VRITRLTIFLLVAALTAWPARALAAADPPKRFALVIGESKYKVTPLTGASDAQEMAARLTALHFHTVAGNDPSGALVDADASTIKKAIIAMADQIREADHVVFYYSGHGFQLDNNNYLLPVGTDSVHQEKLKTNTEVISLRFVLNALGAADTDKKEAAKIVILDACRTSNFVLDGKPPQERAGWRPGLTKSGAPPPQTLLFFAAENNQVADDNLVAGHSPFTSALMLSILEPGLEIRDLLTRVHQDVQDHTPSRQSPHDEGTADFPKPFFFQEPVFLQAVITNADDHVSVQVNDRVVVEAAINETPQKNPNLYALHSGDNCVTIRVFNQKSYQGNVPPPFGIPEGWSYEVQLLRADGTPIVPPLKDREDVPDAHGPHFGKLFTAVTIVLHVSPDKPEVTPGAPQPFGVPGC
jgi:hypothetical protein